MPSDYSVVFSGLEHTSLLSSNSFDLKRGKTTSRVYFSYIEDLLKGPCIRMVIVSLGATVLLSVDPDQEGKRKVSICDIMVFVPYKKKSN